MEQWKEWRRRYSSGKSVLRNSKFILESTALALNSAIGMGQCAVFVRLIGVAFEHYKKATISQRMLQLMLGLMALDLIITDV